MHCLTAKAFDLNNILVKKNGQENPAKPRQSETLQLRFAGPPSPEYPSDGTVAKKNSLKMYMF